MIVWILRAACLAAALGVAIYAAHVFAQIGMLAALDAHGLMPAPRRLVAGLAIYGVLVSGIAALLVRLAFIRRAS